MGYVEILTLLNNRVSKAIRLLNLIARTILFIPHS